MDVSVSAMVCRLIEMDFPGYPIHLALCQIRLSLVNDLRISPSVMVSELVDYPSIGAPYF